MLIKIVENKTNIFIVVAVMASGLFRPVSLPPLANNIQNKNKNKITKKGESTCMNEQ
jgi:hypothetical protein